MPRSVSLHGSFLTCVAVVASLGFTPGRGCMNTLLMESADAYKLWLHPWNLHQMLLYSSSLTKMSVFEGLQSIFRLSGNPSIYLPSECMVLYSHGPPCRQMVFCLSMHAHKFFSRDLLVKVSNKHFPIQTMTWTKRIPTARLPQCTTKARR